MNCRASQANRPSSHVEPPASSVGEADDARFVVIGAGPAGLTAAFELTRHDRAPLVLERDRIVGGISRTESYKGYGFDMGGHRFFSKSEEVKSLWNEILATAGEKFMRRPRLSRIFYNQKMFNYPLKPGNALKNLGVYESMWLMASYCRWRVFPHKREDSFEEWVVNRFGRRLFRTFFKTYTEKVWGISTQELKAEWAAQRIKDLSLKRAILGAVWKPKHGKIKTLIEEFDYPRRGPGMLWEICSDAVEQRGGEVRMEAGVKAIHREGNRITGVTTQSNGTEQHVSASHVITSMPLTELIFRLDPPPPPAVIKAAKSLKYRDFLTVCLIIDEPHIFADNWIYIHDPTVKVGRMQNFKNWSPEMVPEGERESRSSLGLEYFCNEGDELWSMADDALVKLATEELDRLGLVCADKVIDGVVYRVPKSYPVYDGGYAGHVETIRNFIDGLENLKTVGRNGLHRYNNQDHSMLTGIYAVRSLLFGEEHDLWSINADQEYHEEVKSGERPAGAVGRNVTTAAAR